MAKGDSLEVWLKGLGADEGCGWEGIDGTEVPAGAEGYEETGGGADGDNIDSSKLGGGKECRELVEGG